MTAGAALTPSASPAPPFPASAQTARPPRLRHELVFAALFLLALTLAALGPGLLFSRDRVLSNEDADLAMQFVHWRAFGFGEMRTGHLPLWNPHIFGGAPFLGGFQSALLYPPNWLYLILPLAPAINSGIALHVFLAGFFMYLWARERALQPLACAFAAVLFMFCGPHFPHINGGHLPNLCAMVWGPLIFLAIDRWLARRTAGAILLGGGAWAAQILAGHPQYVLYTGIAAAIYCSLALLSAPKRWQAAAGLALLPLLAAALSAAQLFEGFHAAGESLRSHGVTFAFASEFSFAPENFLTTIAPDFFGGVKANTYWGRCSFCEMSLFFGVTGLVCAIYGLVRGPAGDRFRLLATSLVLLLLALGAHTPLFGWLYRHAPEFNRFRGLSKFIYPAILFLIMLAAIGFDTLLAEGLSGMALISGTAFAALALGTVAWWLVPAPDGGPIAAWLRSIYGSGEVFLPQTLVDQPAFQVHAARAAAQSLAMAAGTLLALTLVLALGRRRPAALAGVLLLACAEMLIFARGTRQTFSLAGAQTSPATDYLADHPAPAGSRILNLENPDLAMSIGARDLWGYDPGVLRRYAEWIADSQSVDPDDLNEELPFTRQPALYGSMLGCRYIFSPESMMKGNGGELPVFTYTDANLAPRMSLVTRADVIDGGRDAIFAALRDPSFDPRHSVILETPPQPPPLPGDGPAGRATLSGETSDSLTIDADLARPAILVINDAYSSGWTVQSLAVPGENVEAQPKLQILPADYCLRGIPLPAGHHRLLVAYRPWQFLAGAWISVAALGLYLIAVGTLWRRRLFGDAPG